MPAPCWLRPLAARPLRTSMRRALQRTAFRLRIERLEDRLAPAVFTVTTTDDNGGGNPAPFAGTGTLRQAIIDANASAGADTIQFVIPDALKSPGGWWTIQPQSALPAITDTLALDGTTAAGYAGIPLIELRGDAAGLSDGLAFAFGSAWSSVRGLVINRFSGSAVHLTDVEVTGVVVAGNYLGTDPTGSHAAPNARGVQIDFGSGNIIGGTSTADRNVISGNSSEGIFLAGPANQIIANFIGVDATGIAALGNAGDGLTIYGDNTVIGGTNDAERNVISGNGNTGMMVWGATGLVIQGNYVGTDAAGSHAIGNSFDGVYLRAGAHDNLVGGTVAGADNVISGNGRHGIAVINDVGPNNRVVGNKIGTVADGHTALGNLASGVFVEGSQTFVQGNVIANNLNGGVRIGHLPSNPIAQENTVSGNAIYGNGGLGIDLRLDVFDDSGVTLNDSLGHDGSNHFQNFPVLIAAQYGSVTGTLNSTPYTTFRVEVFANHEVDPSGYGEGERYVGFVNVITDVAGNASFTASLPALLPGEAFLSATATNLTTGDTSEFCADIAFPATPAPSSISGLVWVDFNNDGQVDPAEKVVAGVNVTLTGTDDLGNAVNQTVQTDADGIYVFNNLRPSPSGYTVTETQPAGYLEGRDTLGTVNGSPTGSAAVQDVFSGIVLPIGGSVGENYNFGERPTTTGAVAAGQTAGIGFWQNNKGQSLIQALNGGSTATQLGHWLAVTFSNMYGNLDGMTNSGVAAFYKQLFARTAQTAPAGTPKVDAQVMATALAVYVTNLSLAGTTATAYGFHVTATGVGTRTFDVGSDGAAFGVANNSVVSVLDLLLAVNARSRNGLLYDLNGDGRIDNTEASYRTLANDSFTAINEAGSN